MATFNSFLREIDKAARRSARESARRDREKQRSYNAYLKEQEQSNAYNAVELQEEFLDSLISIHKDCSKTINWQTIQRQPSPLTPIPVTNISDELKKQKELYKPSLLDKIFRLQNYRLKKFENKIKEAEVKEEKQFKEEQKQYDKDLLEWNKSQELAKGILENNKKAYREVFSLYFDMDCFKDFCEGIQISFEDPCIQVSINIKNISIVPGTKLSLTSRGKLSKKDMPVSKRNEIYQDYVCSLILRLSREIIAILPLEKFIINAFDDLINTSTGYLEKQIVVSALISADTINKINFNAIDASDCMKNFVHNMKYSKTKGFTAISQITIQ